MLAFFAASATNVAMLILTRKCPKLYTAVGGLLALLSMSVGFLGLQYFYLSYFAVEPLMLGLFSISLLSLLWILLGVVSGNLTFVWQRKNPLTLLWLAWLLWQTITTIFAAFPIRSFLGPTEQAEGLAWYLMATLLMLQFSALWRSKIFRHVIIHYSLAVIVALSTLHFIFDVSNNLFANILDFDLRGFDVKAYIPFVWPDYIGYLVGWWWIAARLAHKKTPLWLLALQTVLILFCLVSSSNRIAILLVGTGIIGSLSITSIRYFFPYLFCYNNNLIWRRLIITALLAPLFWLMLCAWNGFTVNYSKEAEQSIPTRVLLNHIALTAITDEPSRLLFGKGWGQFEDDFFKNMDANFEIKDFQKEFELTFILLPNNNEGEQSYFFSWLHH